MTNEISKTKIALPFLCVCTFLLHSKVFATVMIQGRKVIRPPEDAFLKITKTKSVDPDIENQKQNNNDNNNDNQFLDGDRWDRIVRNDLENVPYGLILAWACYIADTETLGNWYEYCISVFIILFTIVRYLHTYCYANGIQPWRTILFGFGQVMQSCFGTLLLIEAFNNWIN